MTVRVGKFEKVSREVWQKAFNDYVQKYISYDEYVADSTYTYETIVKLPTRATKGSAGYDVITPFNIELLPNEDVVIPTGIKCRIDNGWGLFALPKSGLGFKYYTRLANTVGLIDEDYYNNENNEGHIFVKLRNEGDSTLIIEKGKAVCQLVFLPYGITYDDEADGIRQGGFGSTGK